jgi:nicotinamidase-related amidase
MGTSGNAKYGLNSLLTPENCVLLLIDHQPMQLSSIGNTNTALLLNNVIALAKTAKAFGVPTILTTVLQDRGGFLPKDIQDVFPEQKPIDRTTINTWEDPKVVEAVKKTGRKKLVIAGLFTEICVAFPAIHALEDGYDVFAVTDASAGTSVEAHERAVQRMIDLAQTLLLETEATLVQVALATGFADQAHMTRVFRKLIGTAPSQWKRATK